MERMQFIERCDEVLSLSMSRAIEEDNIMTEQGRHPILTIFGRPADLSCIFWRESMHRLEDGDIVGPRILGDEDTCIRGIAIWREIQES